MKKTETEKTQHDISDLVYEYKYRSTDAMAENLKDYEANLQGIRSRLRNEKDNLAYTLRQIRITRTALALAQAEQYQDKKD